MSSEHTRPGEGESTSEANRPEERIEDLQVREDTATEVKGGDGISFNYTQVQSTYNKQ